MFECLPLVYIMRFLPSDEGHSPNLSQKSWRRDSANLMCADPCSVVIVATVALLSRLPCFVGVQLHNHKSSQFHGYINFVEKVIGRSG